MSLAQRLEQAGVRRVVAIDNEGVELAPAQHLGGLLHCGAEKKLEVEFGQHTPNHAHHFGIASDQKTRGHNG